MPKFKVVEKRALTATYLMDAPTEEDARRWTNGATVLDTSETDTYADEVLSIEQVDDDAEDLSDV